MTQGRRARFVGRGHERALWLLGAAVLIAVLWAIAQQLKWPVWVQAVLAGLAAAVALIIPELRARFEQDAERKRLLKGLVAVLDRHDRLPQVRAVGLDQLRVHAAQVQVPYIERDQQGKLEAAVGPGQAVLVVGHSMSGKTRLAAKVVKRKFPDALLVAAESGKALRELFDGGLDPAGLVVWLDDLERFLGADGLTVGLLNRLTTGGAIVVATIRVGQQELYRPWNELRPPEWEVLQRFSEISLQRRLTGPELGRVRAMVNDPGVLAAVDHYGLAEYLGAGPEALDKFEKGEIANPVGQALVRAAVDWRRTGLSRPVSQQVLATTLPTYLADRPGVPRTKQAIDEGLAWATARINETVALLGSDFTDPNRPVFEAFDYLIDQLAHTSTPVPEPMWALALEQAESAELFVIGRAANQAGKLATAESAFRQAADEEDSEVAPLAAVYLGLLLERQGEIEEAKAAYRHAIASGHAEAGPSAAFSLGVLLREQDDLAGAKAAFQQAIASGHADYAPKAAFILGNLLARQGDVEGAKAAYRQAIASGHAEAGPGAALGLELLEKQRDLAGAKAAYQQAIASGHAKEAFDLGRLLQEQGDREGAKAAYQRAIASGHADYAPRAAVSLGGLLRKQGDVEGAKAAYRQAAASGHAEVGPNAALNLGHLLWAQGDVVGAKAAFQQAIASGHADQAPLAALMFGLLLWAQGDVVGAEAAYRQAIASGHAGAGPLATFSLGLLLSEQGDVVGAKTAFQQAIASGDVEAAPKAAFNLGLLLEKQGDLAGARVAYQQAIDSGHAEVAPLAADNLRRLRRSTPPPAIS